MVAIGKTYTFSAAHVLVGHPKCGRLHGHNYKVEISVAGAQVSGYNWVMDFAELDSIVKPVLDRLDHRFLLTSSREENLFLELDKAHVVRLPIAASSAEELASLLARTIKSQLPFGVEVFFVKLWETERSWAAWMK